MNSRLILTPHTLPPVENHEGQKNESSDTLRTVRRPKAHAGYVRQCGVVVCRHRWNGINFLGTVARPQQAVAAVVKLRTLFQVVRPISDVDGGTGCSVGLDRVLVAR